MTQLSLITTIGYDERFSGQYGGDDYDFHRRYDVQGEGYRYPDTERFPALFRSLSRRPTVRGLVATARFYVGV